MIKSNHVSSSGSLGTAVSELNLIRFSQQGDRDAFACLYDTYLERIHRYVYFRVIDPEVAEDTTSLVFLRVWENLRTFQSGRSPFAGWLYRIAHNAIVDHYRTRKTLISLEEVAPLKLSYADEVEEKLDRKIRSQELTDALQDLTDIQREVLILRFIFGLTILETARKLDKRQGAIRALQMRGLRRLAVIIPSQEKLHLIGDSV
jgi:RNA polymerase sigma-70 factor, ECF subfamily